MRCEGSRTHSVLQLFDLSRRETVGFCDEWDGVHLFMQSFHELNIHRTQTVDGIRSEGQESPPHMLDTTVQNIYNVCVCV